MEHGQHFILRINERRKKMKSKNKFKKLQSRISDYHKMLEKGSNETMVQRRMNTGGYHCPGSNKK